MTSSGYTQTPHTFGSAGVMSDLVRNIVPQPSTGITTIAHPVGQAT